MVEAGMAPEHRRGDYAILEKLDEIKDDLTTLKNGQFKLHIQLFGEEEGENKHGRVPKLESVAETNTKRISALERFRWWFLGLVAALSVAWEMFKK